MKDRNAKKIVTENFWQLCRPEWQSKPGSISTTMPTIRDPKYSDISKYENHEVFMKGANLRVTVIRIAWTSRETYSFICLLKEKSYADKLLVCVWSMVMKN